MFWRPVDETDTSHQDAKNTHLKSTPFYCHTAAASVSDTTTVNSLDATYQKTFSAEKGPDQLFFFYKCLASEIQMYRMSLTVQCQCY